MPQCKPVKSLKTACLHNIKKNMDNTWCKHYQENVMGQGSFLYLIGPFDYLPGSLVYDIIHILKQEQLLLRKHLQLLITSSLEKLDLSNQNTDMGPILNIISFRCKESLKELNLSNCPKMPKLMLQTVIAELSDLEVLDLSRTNVHDDVLLTVGSHCKKLRELNVSLSHYVSDKGIKYLFMEEDSEDGKHKVGVCKALAKLHIQDTRVSTVGVEAALRHLPNLQYLNHPKLVTVLESMHRSDWEGGMAISPYRLRSLFADYRTGNSSPSSSSSTDVSLSVAADVCPYATDAHILAYRYKNNPDDLPSLCKLKYLRVLNVTLDNSAEYDSTRQMDFFTHAIIPVLQACGNSLSIISLGDFPSGVDVGVIGICCPVLQELNLAFNKVYRNSAANASSSRGRPFSQLKKLNLVCTCANTMVFKDLSNPNYDASDSSAVDLPSHQMKSLLSSPVLESVFIRESSVLTDDLLREVLRNGQKFLHLRDFELEQCHNLTAQFVYSLLNCPGPLKSLKFWQCKKLTRADFNSFKSISRKNRWDLFIDWT